MLNVNEKATPDKMIFLIHKYDLIYIRNILKILQKIIQ